MNPTCIEDLGYSFNNFATCAGAVYVEFIIFFCEIDFLLNKIVEKIDKMFKFDKKWNESVVKIAP